MYRLQVNFFFMYLVSLPFLAKAQKEVKIPAEKDMHAYLKAYFKDDTRGLYLALSNDRCCFTDVDHGPLAITRLHNHRTKRYSGFLHLSQSKKSTAYC